MSITYALWFTILDGVMRSLGALHSTKRLCFLPFHTLEDIAITYGGRPVLPTKDAPATELVFTDPIKRDIGQYLTTQWVLQAHGNFYVQLVRCETAFHAKVLFDRGVQVPIPVVRSEGLSVLEIFEEKLEMEIEEMALVYQQILDDLRDVLDKEIALGDPTAPGVDLQSPVPRFSRPVLVRGRTIFPGHHSAANQE
jgi:hypothetical protein